MITTACRLKKLVIDCCFRAVMHLFAACLLLETTKQKNREFVTVQLSFYPLYTCREAGKRLTVSWDSWLIHSLFPIFILAIHSLFPIFFLTTTSSFALRARDTGFLACLLDDRQTGALNNCIHVLLTIFVL